MSELIENRMKRRELLKHMILQLHKGEAPEAVKRQLARLLGEVPYDDVVLVEQELISGGLPSEEILRLCDLHSKVLKGSIDKSKEKEVPPGHPVHTFREENRALGWELAPLTKLFREVSSIADDDSASNIVEDMRSHFNAMADIEKHYSRKENLLFPYLERHKIEGPPTVMWGKDDEVRELLKAAIEAVNTGEPVTGAEAKMLVETVLKPATDAIEEMIFKEENILFPMCLDTLSEGEWYEVYKENPSIGFCLYDPETEWSPVDVQTCESTQADAERIQMPSGSLSSIELTALLNTIPFDLTFVDSTDTVRYFTQGRDRIFARNRAILGRKVQMCHPPNSVHIVQKILDDFRSGRASRAPFWITLGDRFIHIEYFALRDRNGVYLGTLEVSQDLTEKRELKGEQRLLSSTDLEG
jgi:DUF438 domain-containing protein